MSQMPENRPIPYVPMDLAEPAELVAAIRERRGGQFINLDRMLLHSIPIAQGWNHFVGAIRYQFSVRPEVAWTGHVRRCRAQRRWIRVFPPTPSHLKNAKAALRASRALRYWTRPSFQKS